MPFSLEEKYKSDPVCIGALMGALYAAFITVALTVICLLLHFTDVVSSPAGSESHYGLVIGFVILPLAFLAGAPWSIPFLVLSQSGHNLAAWAIVGVVLGLLTNGTIIGLLVGMRARTRILANKK